MYPEDFKKEEFDNFVQQTITQKQNVTTKGIFAPWAVYKEDITSIGMHDEYFHSYHEDSDIFNRFILNDYTIVQSWEAYVYHLTCRGGQFQDGVDKVTEDPAFHKMKNKAFRNYVRKWGSFVKNDEYQYPQIPHKYSVRFDIENCTPDVFQFLEPWCTNINVDLPFSEILRICKGVCSAMVYLSFKQIIHGDVYAHNILYNDNIVKLTDFGASFHVESKDVYQKMELNEVRSFGYLMQDLINMSSDDCQLFDNLIRSLL
jgi:hypothetical protein